MLCYIREEIYFCLSVRCVFVSTMQWLMSSHTFGFVEFHCVRHTISHDYVIPAFCYTHSMYIVIAYLSTQLYIIVTRHRIFSSLHITSIRFSRYCFISYLSSKLCWKWASLFITLKYSLNYVDTSSLCFVWFALLCRFTTLYVHSRSNVYFSKFTKSVCYLAVVHVSRIADMLSISCYRCMLFEVVGLVVWETSVTYFRSWQQNCNDG